jgi:uncharacterized membrane protein
VRVAIDSLSKTRLVSVLAATGILLALASSPASAAPAPTYTLTAVGRPLPNGVSGAAAINDAGVVVGSEGNTEETNHFQAFSWYHGVRRPIARIPGYSTGANAVNGSGTVVGLAATADYKRTFPWVWQDGKLRKLACPACETMGRVGANDAFDINDHGVIVGTLLRNHEEQAVMWPNARSQPIFLPNHGITESEAMRVNNRGDVLISWGDIQHPIGGISVLRDGILHDLPIPVYGGGAYDMNNNGLVVGFAQVPPHGRTRAVYWKNGRMYKLADTPGTSSLALAVNDRGDIVGTAAPVGARFPTPVLWTHDGQRIELNDAIVNRDDWDMEPRAINNHGVIVANGFLHLSDVEGLVLTPITP